jgi:uncharacterized protein (TIGR03086 family)
MASVQPHQMAAPTPCGSWSVRDLIIHLVDAPVFTSVVLETGDSEGYSYDPIDPAADDFLAGYDAAASALIAAFRVDGAMSRTVTMPVLGKLPGASLVVLATCDAFVHGWDLAHATGISADLDADVAGNVLENIRPLVTEQMRGPDGTALFGTEVAVSSDASPADRLADFLGRRLPAN